MKVFKVGERMNDNRTLINDVRKQIRAGYDNDSHITNVLLSDISISLAMIAEILNVAVSCKSKKGGK